LIYCVIDKHLVIRRAETSLTTQDLPIKALKAEHIAAPLHTVLPIRRRKRLVKRVDGPVSGCLGLESRENIHVDFVSLGQYSQVVCESKGSKVYAALMSAPTNHGAGA
jgi:hypothetical protein